MRKLPRNQRLQTCIVAFRIVNSMSECVPCLQIDIPALIRYSIGYVRCRHTFSTYHISTFTFHHENIRGIAANMSRHLPVSCSSQNE